MDENSKVLVQSFKKLLNNRFGNQVSQITLFGSCASGPADASADADIDIAVILNCVVDWRVRETVYDLAFEAESNSGRLLNISVFSKTEYDSRSIESLLLIENIREQGVPV